MSIMISESPEYIISLIICFHIYHYENGLRAMDSASDNSGIIKILEESRNQTSQDGQSLFGSRKRRGHKKKRMPPA